MQNHKIDNWQYYPEEGILKSKETSCTLKPLLNKLLLHFITSPNTLFSVSDLKQQVWQQEFLTDSAVKKAISELRQQLRIISGTEMEYIKNSPGKGYQLTAQPEILKDSSNNKMAFYLGIIAIPIICLTLWWSTHSSEKKISSAQLLNQNQPSNEAFTLYLQGKSLYYKEGDTPLVEQRFQQSIEADSNANPSHGALLDLWGLKLRSIKLHQRSDELQSKVDTHVHDLKQNSEYMSPDNLVSLAKYYLVNVGDPQKAYTLFKDNAFIDSVNNNSIFSEVYDPHILAFTLALNGDKTQSQQIMAQAEQRFPERNVILWYKAFISLINNETVQAMQDAQWAQRLAPDWYPLVFVASHILNTDTNVKKQQELAWQHLIEFEPNFIHRDLSQYKGIPDLLENLNRIPPDADFEPFEVEILYLLGLYYDHALIQQTARQWLTQHYPEKQMMLTIIDKLFVASVSK